MDPKLKQLLQEIDGRLDRWFLATMDLVAEIRAQLSVAMDVPLETAAKSPEDVERVAREWNPPHVHTRECWDDPGPGHGHPFLICGFSARPDLGDKRCGNTMDDLTREIDEVS